MPFTTPARSLAFLLLTAVSIFASTPAQPQPVPLAETRCYPENKLTLTGREAVPSVATSATATGMLLINPDATISGSINTSGIPAIGVSVRVGAIGRNGPIALALTKSGRNWSVPDGAKLSQDQFRAFKTGQLYAVVLTSAYPSGMLRAQFRPRCNFSP